MIPNPGERRMAYLCSCSRFGRFASFSSSVHDVDEVAQVPAESVEFRDNERIAETRGFQPVLTNVSQLGGPALSSR
jgi:hypothetical protein